LIVLNAGRSTWKIFILEQLWQMHFKIF
jgi:hypothetical protein